MVAEGTPEEVRAGVTHHEVVDLQIQGLPDAGLAALRAHPAVASVAVDLGRDGVTMLHVVPRDGALPVGALAEAATTAGGRLLAVQVARPSLEDAFVALTGTAVSDTGEAVAVGARPADGGDDDG
jgi:hypothetical protein